jgi:hypothetical protein
MGLSTIEKIVKEKKEKGRRSLQGHGYDGSDDQVFLYSKGTITQITDDEYYNPNVEINAKDQIVWEGSDGQVLNCFTDSVVLD